MNLGEMMMKQNINFLCKLKTEPRVWLLPSFLFGGGLPEAPSPISSVETQAAVGHGASFGDIRRCARHRAPGRCWTAGPLGMEAKAGIRAAFLCLHPRDQTLFRHTEVPLPACWEACAGCTWLQEGQHSCFFLSGL